ASVQSLVSWKATRFMGTTSRNNSDPPLTCGRRRALGRAAPSICQSAPGASARRTVDSAISSPGHHSVHRAGSASTAHTSSTVAGRTRVASYRGISRGYDDRLAEAEPGHLCAAVVPVLTHDLVAEPAIEGQ